jgi:hypothetical protein
MKTNKSIPSAYTQERAVPVEGKAEAPRTDPLVRTAHGILIMALVLGCLGGAAATASEHAGGHANALQPGGSIRVGTSVEVKHHHHIVNRPWMY